MVTGEIGLNGLAAPRLVELEQEPGLEVVTTQLQQMEATIVREQTMSRECVTLILVQVKLSSPSPKALQSQILRKEYIRSQ